MQGFEFRKFLSVDESLINAKEARESVVLQKAPKYNLVYLDKTLYGIAPAELVIIGADTGHGKSFLANHIALTNAQQGRKVYLFSLEGHKNEVINRWKWSIICREYYKDPIGLDMKYALYELNGIPGIERYDKKAEEELLGYKDNLFIFDRSTDLTVPILTQQISAITDADLVVIDHLHYFDMLNDKSETQNISEIMKAIKGLTEDYNLPVVLVSHLRKKDGKRGLPDNEDLMGSSNIAKIATTCIFISSNPENHNLSKGIYATHFRIGKSRAGASTTLAAEMYFDSRKNRYEEGCTLGKVINGSYKELDEYPDWALKLIKQKEESILCSV
jgi:replicative DNA helicase